tara:strand:+ start:1335 stop:1859 length:525 start_codon:yes stop_codon:yes gene_type:complete
MSDRYKNYGKPKKEEDEDEEPVRLTVKERRDQHRARHPDDLVSFGEEPRPKKPRATPRKKTPVHALTLIREVDTAVTKQDVDRREVLMSRSIRDIRTMCKFMFESFMVAKNVTREDMSQGILPIDDEAEVIREAKGAGRGKEGFVDWLMRYDGYFRAVQKEMELSHEMGQTLLG